MSLSLGERLKELRAARELTVAQAASAMDISQGGLSDYERDSKKPGYEALQKLSHFYGVSYEYLFCESDSKKAENVDISARLGLDDEVIGMLEEGTRADEQRPKPPTNTGYEDFISATYMVNRFLRECLEQGVFSGMRDLCYLLCEGIEEPSKASEYAETRYFKRLDKEMSTFESTKLIEVSTLIMKMGCEIIGHDDLVELKKFETEKSIVSSLYNTLLPIQNSYLNAKSAYRYSKDYPLSADRNGETDNGNNQ